MASTVNRLLRITTKVEQKIFNEMLLLDKRPFKITKKCQGNVDKPARIVSVFVKLDQHDFKC